MQNFKAGNILKLGGMIGWMGLKPQLGIRKWAMERRHTIGTFLPNKGDGFPVLVRLWSVREIEHIKTSRINEGVIQAQSRTVWILVESHPLKFDSNSLLIDFYLFF